MKHSIIGKIDKVAFPVFVVLLVIVSSIASSILWTHVILFIVQKSQTNQIYVGDPYQDNYTVVEISEDRKITMVVNNTNHVLYDVMRSGWSTYLMVHLDQNGLPTKRTEPVVSERPDIELFDSDFNLAHELIQSIPMFIIHIFYFIAIVPEILKSIVKDINAIRRL